MIAIAYDSSGLCLVIVEAKPTSLDSELEGAVAAVTQLAHDSNRQKSLATFVMVVDQDVAPPSAAWRRRFAEAEGIFQRLSMAFVTKSALARGVITAVRWMSGARPGVFHQTHETFESAVTASERQAGRPMPQLAALHDACRRDIAERRRRAS
jgi:hypothetical protein